MAAMKADSETATVDHKTDKPLYSGEKARILELMEATCRHPSIATSDHVLAPTPRPPRSAPCPTPASRSCRPKPIGRRENS